MKTISIEWSTPDVLEVAPDLTEEEADRVLELAESHHDANEGINWIVLEYWAGEVKRERK